MEITNLMFAIIGHVLASVLYLINRFKSPPKAVVDRSSILERKEEIIQLWESKMMANEEPAILEESPKGEEKAELKVPNGVNGDAHKIPNGVSNHEPIEKEEDEKLQRKTDETIELSAASVEAEEMKKLSDDIADTLEETKAKEVATPHEQHEENEKPETKSTCEETEVTETEKICSSTLQETLVVTNVEVIETKTEEIVETTTTVEVAQCEDSQDDFEELERRIEAEESLRKTEKTEEIKEEVEETPVEEPVMVEVSTSKTEREEEVVVTAVTVDEVEEQPSLSSDHAELTDSLEDGSQLKGHEPNEAVVLDATPEGEKSTGGILMNGVGEDDPYRPLADFLPPADDNIEEDIATSETAFTQNGESEEKTFDDHFVLDTRELVSPASDTDKKDSSSGKKSRIHTLGVQKTEQPYSTCTTETKIAMEIREMREREEELKLMRERQATVSPAPPPQQKPKTSASPTPTAAARTSPLPKATSPVGYGMTNNSTAKMSTPGYRVSSVFGHRAVTQQAKDESKYNRKESPVEKEIRQAKDREEELRKQKGLPPREDDSYVKPSQVKSSQAKVFGKISNAETSRLLATAKIQHEIQEQTQREMALRESGHIQTISTERTDSKVTKLKTVDLSPECLSPTFQNGNSLNHTNGTTFSNGHISPENGVYRRSSPSPTGSNYSSPGYSMPRNILSPTNKGISMQKFIASRGKETTFSAPRNGPFSSPRSPDHYVGGDVVVRSAIPDPGKLKRTVSVESKIQQEIMEMKMREEELKMIHSGKASENGDEYDAVPKSPRDFQNGQSVDSDVAGPRRNNLIAQWEQRIQNAEGRA